MIEKWIKDALEYSLGTHSYEDVLESIYNGDMQLFANKGGCVVTQITKYPQKKVLYIYLAGGDFDSVVSLNDEVVQYARSKECDSLMQIGRLGWTKKLKEHGWEYKSACMTKVI